MYQLPSPPWMNGEQCLSRTMMDIFCTSQRVVLCRYADAQQLRGIMKRSPSLPCDTSLPKILRLSSEEACAREGRWVLDLGAESRQSRPMNGGEVAICWSLLSWLQNNLFWINQVKNERSCERARKAGNYLFALNKPYRSVTAITSLSEEKEGSVRTRSSADPQPVSRVSSNLPSSHW